MFSLINITIFTLWFVSALADYLDFTHIWQLKEYRWDRFKDFLNTQQGKIYLTSYPLFYRSILAIGFFFWPINEVIIIKYILIAFFSLDIVHTIYKKYKHQLKRPDFTKKAVLIIILAIILEGSLFILKHDWTALFVLLVVRFFISGAIVYLVNIPTKLIIKYTIEKAKKKLKGYPELIKIGITGSYGKTATKEFLSHILGKKFTVIKTPNHVNTDFGIAKFILKTDFTNAKIFIVEMGAYKVGDLKEHCYLINPKIGILTAIAEQHLSIFGCIKNIQEAKYDLLRALPKNGLAVTNSDNPYCREFLHELKCGVRTFGTEEEYHPTILVKNIEDSIEGTKCTVKFTNSENVTVQSNLRGAHNVSNVMPCVLVADYLGMNKEEIIKAVEDLPQTIDLRQYGQSRVINDSYNSNFIGFKAALDYVTNFPSTTRKIVITRGMLELGEKSFEMHERMAGEIAYATDELVVITPDATEAFKEGIKNITYKLDIKEMYDPDKLLEYFKSLKNTNSTILLENRMPIDIIGELEKNSTKL